MKKQMKKVLCVVLSILMTFSYAVPAFAGSIDNTHLSRKHSDVQSDAEVKAVEKKIDAIGKVHYTDKSLAKIIVAENAYNALSDKQKSNVSNYGALKSARNAYDALVADNIDTSSYTITDCLKLQVKAVYQVIQKAMHLGISIKIILLLY